MFLADEPCYSCFAQGVITLKKLLLADNIEMNKSIIHEIFSSEFEIVQASGSETAFQLILQYRNSISIILINESIAKNFTKEIVGTLTNLKVFENIPVLLILNNNSSRMKQMNIDMHFSDVVSSPVNPFVIQKRVGNLVELYSHKNELEDLVEKQTEKIVSQNKVMKDQQKKINTINNDMLDTLSTVIEYRDVESGRHIHRIKKFTEVMLRHLADKYPEYKMNEEKINLIASASSLHDIGKIAIPDSILLSPRRLTYDEFKIMKEHTVKGCDLLDQLDTVEKNEYFTYCYDICRYHHEKYDGMGYPDGLKGDEIPIWAQVVSVADCYDALTSERPYKAAFTHEQAVDMIRTGACGKFSDKMMECFSASLAEFKALAQEYADVNHVDSSLSKGDETKLTEDTDKESRDIYRKMDREDLIRTIENQKEEMQKSVKKNGEILNRVSDYVFEFDIKKDITLDRKGSFKELVGYEPKNYSEAVMLLGELVAEEYRNKFRRAFRMEHIVKELKNGNERIVLECPMKLGSDIYAGVRCTAVPVEEDGETARVFVSMEALSHSSVTSSLDEILTDRDPVTGLWNYNGLKNEISDFISNSGKNGTHMLILIDIDGFRSINRRTGYRFGNEILKDIGSILRQQFSESSITGRVEDDNFIVFVKDVPSKEETISIVDNIFRKLHKIYEFDGVTYPELSACIGVAEYPKYGRTFDKLFANATKAVDIGKINGKNMYLFYNDNMRDSFELSTFVNGRELNSHVIDFERHFVPAFDSSTDMAVSYDVIETSVDNEDESYDFDDVYASLYGTTNITAVSLNSLRRIFSVIYKFEQDGIILPKLTITTIFSGSDGDVVAKALEDILSFYPINCHNVCINLTQDMLNEMDMRSAVEFTEVIRSYGFEIGVYNVGMNSVSTKIFTKHLVDRITFSTSFITEISDGLIPVEAAVCLMDCFAGSGVYTYFPVHTDNEIIKQVIKRTGTSFGIYSQEFLSSDEFVSIFTNPDGDERLYPALSSGQKNALEISDRLYDEILEQTRSFIFEWIPRLDSVKFSGSFEKMYGYKPPVFEFVKNIRKSGLLHSDDVKKFIEKINFARSESDDTECLVRIYNANNESYVWNRIHFVAVRNAAGVPAKIMAVCADVSEERSTMSEDSSRKDRTDYITNLYNKTAAENKIKSYLYDEGVSGTHAIIVAEICGFDRIEKEFGKPFANAVLKESAENVRELFRDSDIIGRINGSQFLIFVKGLGSRAKLTEKAQTIIAALDNTFRDDKEEVSVKGKVGISIYPDDGQSFEELYDAASKALYYSMHSVSKSTTFALEENMPKRLDQGKKDL